MNHILEQMPDALERVFQRLTSLPDLRVLRDVPLANYTRFGIGGPAKLLAITSDTETFLSAVRATRESQLPYVIIGAGTNLIVSDDGYPGIVLKFDGQSIRAESREADQTAISVEAGALLQSLVDYTVSLGLDGLHTMTGIPGLTGAAIYGNAGAYGHSISEFVNTVCFFDGERVREIGNAECEFHYRHSIFKNNKQWVILSSQLMMHAGDAAQLREKADQILSVRNKKYPPTMKCAGSIFKNYLLAELPPSVVSQIPPNVVIEGKVPSAWFLEQIGAKGMKQGGIHVADYHANLIYNAGDGTAKELVSVIQELKRRMEDRWGVPLVEEVQYVGFAEPELSDQAAAS